MAQSGFTPISLYYSSVAGNIPNASDLVPGELALNIADGAAYYKDATGVVERLNSGSGPTFNVSGAALQPVAPNTFTKVAFDIVEFDSNAAYDTVQYRFVPPTRGFYQINACVTADVCPTPGTAIISIFKNGLRASDGNEMVLSTTQQIQLTASTVLYFNGTGDFVEVFVEQTSSSTINMGAENAYTSFSGISYGIPSGSTPPPSDYDVDFLVVAGGGGGGYGVSVNNVPPGGGGAGGLTHGTAQFVGGTTYLITVGAGGPAHTVGSPSSLQVQGGPFIANNFGGGFGGLNTDSAPSGNGGNGGSGGGPGRMATPGSGTPGQGNNGGAGYDSNGGGGATQVGNTNGRAAGGDGYYSGITGTGTWYAGGGGGGGGGPGGQGGGGTGGDSFGPPGPAGLPGAINSGGGGGAAGGYTNAGGSGGSGVVILSIPSALYSGVTTGNPVVTTVGADTVLTYRSSGSYTA